MAKTTELARLFKAIGTGDLAEATVIAGAISAGEEKRGHHVAARLLLGSLRPNLPRATNGTAAQGGTTNLMLGQALTRSTTQVLLDEVKLRAPTRVLFNDLVAEWHHAKELAASGFTRRSRLLFHGAPGCGKSLSACALGNTLTLPVYVVRLDAIIGAYLGQTALHLREVFRFAESQPCVLLIDEVDALGKSRGSPLDVGELDRIVITLMQELEHVEPAGFVVATSNLFHRLDDALARRFDLSLEFPRPRRPEVMAFATAIAGKRQVPLTPVVRKQLQTTTSYADAERIVNDYARRKLLSGLNGERRGHGR